MENRNSKLPAFKIDVESNLGKRNYKEYISHAGLLRNSFERNGEIVEEELYGYTIQSLLDYYIEEYNSDVRRLADNPNIYGGRLNAESIFIEHVIDHIHSGRIHVNGTLCSFITGDFGNLYRSLILYIRSYYATEVYYNLLKNKGFTARTGTDHGTYLDAVIACFAVKRPDYARRFFPKELGLVTRSHNTLNNAGSLIMALLYDDVEWKEKSIKKAKKYLQGKRQVGERAVVGYLVDLHAGNTAGMSENLQLMMSNYRKSVWLVMGTACRITLYGYYLMANVFLPEELFKQVQRPCGPGWWNEYIDLCLQEPVPADLAEPYLVFPKPLDFFNELLLGIDMEPPPGTVINSLDLKKY